MVASGTVWLGFLYKTAGLSLKELSTLLESYLIIIGEVTLVYMYLSSPEMEIMSSWTLTDGVLVTWLIFDRQRVDMDLILSPSPIILYFLIDLISNPSPDFTSSVSHISHDSSNRPLYDYSLFPGELSTFVGGMDCCSGGFVGFTSWTFKFISCV